LVLSLLGALRRSRKKLVPLSGVGSGGTEVDVRRTAQPGQGSGEMAIKPTMLHCVPTLHTPRAVQE